MQHFNVSCATATAQGVVVVVLLLLGRSVISFYQVFIEVNLVLAENNWLTTVISPFQKLLCRSIIKQRLSTEVTLTHLDYVVLLLALVVVMIVFDTSRVCG